MCRTCHWKCYFPRIIFFAYENMVVGQQITFCVPLTACTLRLDTARENAVLVHIRYGHLKGEREKWSKSESFMARGIVRGFDSRLSLTTKLHCFVTT